MHDNDSVVSAVLRVVLGGNGNLMVQLDFIILNSRPRMHVQNQRNRTSITQHQMKMVRDNAIYHTYEMMNYFRLSAALV